jgi:hypothetical protein
MGVWSASSSGRALPPVKRHSITHWLGSWVGLRAGLDTEARGKILASAGDRAPVVQSVVRHSQLLQCFSQARNFCYFSFCWKLIITKYVVRSGWFLFRVCTWLIRSVAWNLLRCETINMCRLHILWHLCSYTSVTARQFEVIFLE